MTKPYHAKIVDLLAILQTIRDIPDDTELAVNTGDEHLAAVYDITAHVGYGEPSRLTLHIVPNDDDLAA